MNRTLASMGFVMLAVAVAVLGCTRDSGTPPTPAAATPAAKAATTPVAKAAAPADEAGEELYVDVEAEPDEGAPPLTVKLTASVEDATPPLSYKWDFGDGSPASSEAAPTHVYEKPGEYTATVTVKDAKGQSGSEDVDVLVETE